jgi:hypothetical protein
MKQNGSHKMKPSSYRRAEILLFSSMLPITAWAESLHPCQPLAVPQIDLSSSETYIHSMEASCLANPGPSNEEIQHIYEEAMKPMIRETERPLVFFHYGWRTKRPAGSVAPGCWDNSANIASSDGLGNDGLLALDGGIGAQQYFSLHLRGQFEAEKEEGFPLALSSVQLIGMTPGF